jgi:hypothetical protein
MKDLCAWIETFDDVYNRLCDAGMTCKDAASLAEFSARHSAENKGETNDYIDQ